MAKVGEIIRELRKAKGLSLGQVALRSGLDRTYISRIESGKIASPSHKTLEKITRGLNVTAAELFRKEKPDARLAEEEIASYGTEYYSDIEREYIRKLLDILRGANEPAILGIKINIDLFYQSRNRKQTVREKLANL